jgi:hypothetical protein
MLIIAGRAYYACDKAFKSRPQIKQNGDGDAVKLAPGLADFIPRPGSVLDNQFNSLCHNYNGGHP